jgi:hypothetical protein
MSIEPAHGIGSERHLFTTHVFLCFMVMQFVGQHGQSTIQAVLVIFSLVGRFLLETPTEKF